VSTYLLDYENVSHHGFEGYAQLTPEDTVVVFVGAKNGSAGIPVDTVRQLTAIGSSPRLLWKRAKKSAPNYLDFQLVSYLGYLIGDPEIDEQEFVIVSKDQGFLACVDFWAERRREVKISVRPTIARESSAKAADPGTGSGALPAGPASAASPHVVNESTKKAVREAVKDIGLKPQNYTAVYNALSKAMNLQNLHALLAKGLGQPLASQVYHAVKEMFEGSEA
jgi:hypothetical protein